MIAEIKNVFKEDINDPDLIELLYRGVAEPLRIVLVKVQRRAMSKIVNRQPEGNPLKVIRNISHKP